MIAVVVVLYVPIALGSPAVGKLQDRAEPNGTSEILQKIARTGNEGDPRKAYLLRWSVQMNFGGTGDLRREYALHLSRELRKIHNVIPFELKSDYSQPIDIAFVLTRDIGEAANGTYRYLLDAVYSTPEEAASAAQSLSSNETTCFAQLLIVGEQIRRAVAFVSTAQSHAEVRRCISRSLLASYGINTPNDEASVLNPERVSEITELTSWDLEALKVLYSYEGPLVLERRN